MSGHYQKAYFLLSVAEAKQLPPDEGVEVAIVGRSNAGKSSVLNRITQNKGLARVSKTPGRTQLINIFVLDEDRRLVDLPGYGFAKVPLTVKNKWEKNIENYLGKRESLRGLVIVMDIRHPMRDLDLQMLAYCEHHALPVHIVLNKADKLSRSAVAQTMRDVQAALTGYSNSVTLQSFSALKGAGIPEIRSILDQWYAF